MTRMQQQQQSHACNSSSNHTHATAITYMTQHKNATVAAITRIQQQQYACNVTHAVCTRER